jgi:hypothetical protein
MSVFFYLGFLFCRELKLMACRAFAKMALLIIVMLLYVLLWLFCNACILWMAAGTCAVSVLCLPFLSPACITGLICMLVKGIQIPLRFDVKWNT